MPFIWCILKRNILVSIFHKETYKTIISKFNCIVLILYCVIPFYFTNTFEYDFQYSYFITEKELFTHVPTFFQLDKSCAKLYDSFIFSIVLYNYVIM